MKAINLTPEQVQTLQETRHITIRLPREPSLLFVGKVLRVKEPLRLIGWKAEFCKVRYDADQSMRLVDDIGFPCYVGHITAGKCPKSAGRYRVRCESVTAVEKPRRWELSLVLIKEPTT